MEVGVGYRGWWQENEHYGGALTTGFYPYEDDYKPRVRKIAMQQRSMTIPQYAYEEMKFYF